MLCKPLSILAHPDFPNYFNLYCKENGRISAQGITELDVKNMYLLSYIADNIPELDKYTPVFLTDADNGYLLGDATLKYYASVLYQLKTKGHCYTLLYPFDYPINREGTLFKETGETIKKIEIGGDMLVLLKLTVSRELLFRIYKKIFYYTYYLSNIWNNVSLTRGLPPDLELSEAKDIFLNDAIIINEEVTERLLALEDENDYLLLKIIDGLYYFISYFTILNVVSVRDFKLIEGEDDLYKERYGLDGTASIAMLKNCLPESIVKIHNRTKHLRITFNGILNDYPNLFLFTDTLHETGLDSGYNFKPIKPADIVSATANTNYIAKIERRDV